MSSEASKCSQCGKDSAAGALLCAECQTQQTVDGLRLPTDTGQAPTLGQASAVAPPASPFDETPNPQALVEFGDYELIAEVARGGMGVVYKARHIKLNRVTALKMILGGRFSSQDDIQRFNVEAEAAARLDHPGIVPIYEISESDGQPYLAMKFIEGGSLAEHCARIRSDTRRMVKLVIGVARAVHHAHQRGILHRDLKPGNILLDEDDNPLITDLGLAKSTTGDSKLTHTGAVLGTPSYMPPEQAEAGQTLTTSADIYSIGAILYELLTGQPPHQGRSAVETVMRVLNDPIKPPRELDSGIDRDLALICMHCLNKEPEARYATAADLANDLQCWLNDEQISVRSPSIWRMASQWIKRNQGIGLAVLALLTGCVFSFPIIISILGALSDPASLYADTPEDPRPLIYSFTNIPTWISIVSALFVLLLWPSLGLIIAVLSRPDSLRKAAIHGGFVGATCGLLFAILLGWIFFVLTAQANANQAVKVLARNVWPVEWQTREEAEQAALKIVPGIEELPVEERADYVSNRVFADSIAVGPHVWFFTAFFSMILAIPIMYGTTIAYTLVSRGIAWWLVGIRYFVAYTCVTASTLGATAWLMGARVNGSKFSDSTLGMKFIILVVLPGGAYLALRHWRSKRPTSQNSV